jgi:hypothetical protein
MTLDYLFLPVIFLIGGITSYQDFKYGKIKNKWIVLGLCWGAVVYISLVILKFFNPAVISYSYIFAVLINSGIALVVGYGLWHFDLWSAGDAKLFFVFAFLFPLEYYGRGYLPYFPAFALLVNVFVPAAIYLAMQNLISVSAVLFKTEDFLNSAIYRLKSEYISFLKIVFGFFLAFVSFQIIRFEIKDWPGEFGAGWSILVLLAALAGFKFLKKIFGKGKIWASIILSLFIVFYLAANDLLGKEEKIIAFLSVIKDSLIFTIIFGLAFILLSYETKDRQKVMPFAVWLFFGAIITIIIKKSLISFFFF